MNFKSSLFDVYGCQAAVVDKSTSPAAAAAADLRHDVTIKPETSPTVM